MIVLEMCPLWQRLLLYVHPKASATARGFEAFITFILSVEAFRRAGLIPLSEAAIERMAKEAADKAQAGGS